MHVLSAACAQARDCPCLNSAQAVSGPYLSSAAAPHIRRGVRQASRLFSSPLMALSMSSLSAPCRCYAYGCTQPALPAQRQPYTYAAPLILRQPLSKWRKALASRHIPALARLAEGLTASTQDVTRCSLEAHRGHRPARPRTSHWLAQPCASALTSRAISSCLVPECTSALAFLAEAHQRRMAATLHRSHVHGARVHQSASLA